MKECLNHNMWVISFMLISCSCGFSDGFYRTVVFVVLYVQVECGP